MREGEGRERRGEGEYQQIGESIYQRDSVCNQNKEISSAYNMDVEDWGVPNAFVVANHETPAVVPALLYLAGETKSIKYPLTCMNYQLL